MARRHEYSAARKDKSLRAAAAASHDRVCDPAIGRESANAASCHPPRIPRTRLVAELDRPLWLRHPAVSPDGTQIAFAYAGQIWIVPAGGGEAIALTDGNFYSTAPVWSPDSKRIAFASTRYGNDDVFVMPVAGGEIKRLTYHSADDIPMAFSPDGAEIYFSSPRLGDATATGLDRCVGSARC
jgi:dipeptidyl aminopeptidase/acylaminoacyl peptidase